jgi:hypothetical protein
MVVRNKKPLTGFARAGSAGLKPEPAVLMQTLVGASP